MSRPIIDALAMLLGEHLHLTVLAPHQRRGAIRSLNDHLLALDKADIAADADAQARRLNSFATTGINAHDVDVPVSPGAIAEMANDLERAQKRWQAVHGALGGRALPFAPPPPIDIKAVIKAVQAAAERLVNPPVDLNGGEAEEPGNGVTLGPDEIKTICNLVLEAKAAGQEWISEVNRAQARLDKTAALVFRRGEPTPKGGDVHLTGSLQIDGDTIAKCVAAAKAKADGALKIGCGEVATGTTEAPSKAGPIPDSALPVCYGDGSMGVVMGMLVDDLVSYSAHRKGMVSTGGHASVSDAVAAMTAQIAARSKAESTAKTTTTGEAASPVARSEDIPAMPKTFLVTGGRATGLSAELMTKSGDQVYGNVWRSQYAGWVGVCNARNILVTHCESSEQAQDILRKIIAGEVVTGEPGVRVIWGDMLRVTQTG